MVSKNVFRCDFIARGVLFITTLLSVVAFIPGNFIPSASMKGYILITGVFIAFLAWLLGRLFEGQVILPRSKTLISLGVLLGALLLSALFSETPQLSFLGEGFGSGTFLVLASLILGSFLLGVLYITRARIVRLLSGIFIVYLLIALYQIVHLVLPGVTSFNTFFDRIETPLGVLSDLAFFSGIVLVGITLFVEFLRPSQFMKIVSFVVGLLALFYILLANVSLVWIVTGLGVLFVLIYKLVVTQTQESRKFPTFALIVALVCILFIFANKLVGAIVPSLVGVSFTNITPSIPATVDVAIDSLRSQPIFGAGPNRFATEWFLWRSPSVNAHQLWNVPFSTGFGYLPTVAFLGGIVSILAMLFFMASLALESVKRTFVRGDKAPHVFGFSLFLLVMYSFAVLLFGAPSISIIVLSFVFLGLFIASLHGYIPEKAISFLKDQRISFFSILTIILLIIASIGTLYATTERFVSLVYFNKAAVAGGVYGDYMKADARLATAVRFSDSPRTERARVLVAREALDDLIASSQDKRVSQETLKLQLQQVISVGDTSGRQAIALDTKDVQNYLTLGRFMASVASLKVEGAFEASEGAYKRAIEIAPNYPESYLALASLYFSQEKNEEALGYVYQALEKKPNYTDAFYLLAQAEIEAGNTAAAISKIEEATAVDPRNPNLYFTLGLLRFEAENYEGAVSAFRASVNLDPSSANSWYFLALALSWSGDTAEASEILVALDERIPNNQNITSALRAVERGERIPRNTDTPALPVAEETQ